MKFVYKTIPNCSYEISLLEISVFFLRTRVNLKSVNQNNEF